MTHWIESIHDLTKVVLRVPTVHSYIRTTTVRLSFARIRRWVSLRCCLHALLGLVCCTVPTYAEDKGRLYLSHILVKELQPMGLRELRESVTALGGILILCIPRAWGADRVRELCWVNVETQRRYWVSSMQGNARAYTYMLHHAPTRHHKYTRTQVHKYTRTQQQLAFHSHKKYSAPCTRSMSQQPIHTAPRLNNNSSHHQLVVSIRQQNRTWSETLVMVWRNLTSHTLSFGKTSNTGSKTSPLLASLLT